LININVLAAANKALNKIRFSIQILDILALD
jgi:hypothetical protein